MTELTVSLEGPFFTYDPGKTLYHNIGDMLDAIADELEADVRAEIASHEGSMPFYTGWSADHVVGYRTSPKTGKHWAVWAAVASLTSGMSRTDAIRTKAAAAGIERRFHPYRHAKDAVYRSRALLSADLAKGLN